MQSCSSCTKLNIDLRMFDGGVIIDKCEEFNFHVPCPMLSGWECPRYQCRYNKKKSFFKKILEKIKGEDKID